LVDAQVVHRIGVLTRLQDVDTRLAELRAALAKLPERAQGVEARLQAARTRLEEVQASAAEDVARIRRLELDIGSAEQKRSDYQRQQASIKGNKEYAALTAEIAAAEERISAAEDEVLDLMEAESSRQEAVAREQAELDRVQAETDQELNRIAAKEAATKEEQARMLQARESAASDLSETDLRLYEKIRSMRDGLAVVQVMGTSCGGCYQAVPPQRVAEARAAKKLVHCEYCGRILTKS
jgi:predicted  nucleic acid-binding Zn-ribbon protein